MAGGGGRGRVAELIDLFDEAEAADRRERIAAEAARLGRAAAG